MAASGSLEGICPYALAFVNEIIGDANASAAVLTTTCDQMRHAADLIHQKSDTPVFLMNVPATWQTAASRRLYRAEMERLGRFLVDLGGRAPSSKELARVMLKCGTSRKNDLYSNCYARASLECAGLTAPSRRTQKRRQAAALQSTLTAGKGYCLNTAHSRTSAMPLAIPIALIGGPLPSDEHWLIDAIEKAGGRIALDATESGERTMPAPFDSARSKADPMAELVRAYFDSIPDVFQRPNTRLYEWLDRMLVERGAKGIILRHYVWCDLWHAEAQRLVEWSKVPVLHIDTEGGNASKERTVSRIEAFFETLNSGCHVAAKPQ
jgi:benzoyl-CoA reductase/2-hydroxyglutaryl-CoA dehydratase subunit BcrC/BadD/HgdB